MKTVFVVVLVALVALAAASKARAKFSQVAESDARALCAAVKGWGTDEAAIYRIVERTEPKFHKRRVAQEFRETPCGSDYDGSLYKWLEEDLSKAQFKRIKHRLLDPMLEKQNLFGGLVEGAADRRAARDGSAPAEAVADANTVCAAIKGWGTDEATVVRIVLDPRKSVSDIRRAWAQTKCADKSLYSALYGDLSGSLWRMVRERLTVDPRAQKVASKHTNAAKDLCKAMTKYAGAHKLLKAMSYGLLASPKSITNVISRVIEDPDNSFNDLRIIELYFQSSTACAGEHTLEKWIRSETECEMEDHLLKMLTNREYKSQMDRKAILARLPVPAAEAAALQQTRDEMDESEKQGFVKSCWKGIKEGVGYSINSWISLGKAIGKGVAFAVTNPAGAARSVGCFVRKAVRGTFKWTGKALSKLANAGKVACKKGFLKCLAAVGVGALMVANPISFVYYLAIEAVVQISTFFSRLYAEKWTPLSQDDKNKVRCMIITVLGVELLFIPFAFKFIAVKMLALFRMLGPKIAAIMGTTKKALKAGATRYTASTKKFLAGKMSKKQLKTAVKEESTIIVTTKHSSTTVSKTTSSSSSVSSSSKTEHIVSSSHKTSSSSSSSSSSVAASSESKVAAAGNTDELAKVDDVANVGKMDEADDLVKIGDKSDDLAKVGDKGDDVANVGNKVDDAANLEKATTTALRATKSPSGILTRFSRFPAATAAKLSVMRAQLRALQYAESFYLRVSKTGVRQWHASKLGALPKALKQKAGQFVAESKVFKYCKTCQKYYRDPKLKGTQFRDAKTGQVIKNPGIKAQISRLEAKIAETELTALKKQMAQLDYAKSFRYNQNGGKGYRWRTNVADDIVQPKSITNKGYVSNADVMKYAPINEKYYFDVRMGNGKGVWRHKPSGELVKGIDDLIAAERVQLQTRAAQLEMTVLKGKIESYKSANLFFFDKADDVWKVNKGVPIPSHLADEGFKPLAAVHADRVAAICPTCAKKHFDYRLMGNPGSQWRNTVTGKIAKDPHYAAKATKAQTDLVRARLVAAEGELAQLHNAKLFRYQANSKNWHVNKGAWSKPKGMKAGQFAAADDVATYCPTCSQYYFDPRLKGAQWRNTKSGQAIADPIKAKKAELKALVKELKSTARAGFFF